ncbi:MAG: Crp/Fnr family transcriptional regulator, partial [Bacteroidales bacterium]
LNSLSVRAQNGVRTLLNMSMNSPESRFAMWIVPLTGYNTEDLQLSCRKTNLASILGISRPTLDTLLQDLQKKEMIRAEKGVIHILDREKFAEYIK